MTAYNDRDLEKFLSFLHPEFESYLFDSNHQLCSGIEGARRVYEKRFRENEDLFITTLQRIINDNFVVESQLIEGFDEGKTIHAIAIFELKNNKVIRASFIRRQVKQSEVLMVLET